MQYSSIELPHGYLVIRWLWYKNICCIFSLLELVFLLCQSHWKQGMKYMVVGII